ncbi:MAG: GNAT family N-acetyltransferase, partial [Pseudomonadota bacterium]
LLPPSSTCVVEPPPGSHECPPRVIAFCKQRGFESIRFYLAGPEIAHRSWPAYFVRGEETAMCGNLADTPFEPLAPDISVRALQPDDDRLKKSWLDMDSARPDGKATSGSDYVAIENAKADARYMDNYVITERGEPIGSFGISLGQPDLVRIKNLLLAEPHRGRGLGYTAIAFAAQEARRLSRGWIGAFVLTSGTARNLYERAGLRDIGVQTEMMAPLELLADAEI